MLKKKKISPKGRPIPTLTPKVWKLDEGHVVEPAFKSGDTQYYMLKDSFNSFCMRALTGIAAYEEWEMRCDRNYLDTFAKALDAAINNPNAIRIQDLVVLKMQLDDRLNFALPTMEVVYRFASVVFFDENESPYRYDEVYNREKIERWKKDMDIPAFFLTVPIKTLIPLPVISEIDLKTYYQTLELVDKKHLSDLQEIISSRQRKTATIQA